MLKDTLLSLAQNPHMREFVVQNRITRGISRRFVAGELLNDAVQATRTLNQAGIQVALDLLGENVADEQEAQFATEQYCQAIDLIPDAGLEANISIKLTALGLDVSPQLCVDNFRVLLTRAQQKNVFVCIDMEGSEYTERTIDMTLRMRKEFENVGTVIQTYLYRSAGDIARLVEQGVRVRLVKGAYKEQQDIAFQEKRDVDQNYANLMKVLLARGNFPAIATHDETLLQEVKRFVGDYGIGKSAFEFQMLYGVRRDLQEKLVKDGYNMRVYVPYGVQWYPYLMRRMAERPANLMFVFSNMLRS
ncbi:MAG TPA: proline dehydrogenase family protein [Dictyobacter sp.]|jgi:proline dehydrogenase|nr:proline dehydrogenase family protein [Dictyobacter sp.]